jgi:Spy/CpxP family protein refolding chaperone
MIKMFKGGQRMKSKAIVTGLAVISMVLTVAWAVQARPFGPGSRDGGPGAAIGGLKAVLALKLSEDQQAQLMNIIGKYEEQREGLRSRMIEARKKLAAVLKAEAFSEEDARKTFREASEVRENLFVLRAKMMSEMKAVLTPEQLQQLQEEKAQRHERMKHRFEAWTERNAE